MTMKSSQIPTTATSKGDPYAWAKTYVPPADLGIEKPLAPARPNGTSPDSGSSGEGSSSPKSMNPFQFVLSQKDAYDRESAIVQKYKSIDSLNKADKVKALSDVNLNPYNLANPYDGLANSLHRWKTVAAQANNGHFSNEEMGKIASNYYDKMIAPMYGGMKIAPMDKGLWLKQAYSEALKYNLEDSYDSSIVHGLKNGAHTGAAELARASGYVTDMLGNVLDDSVALWKRAHTVQPGQTPEQVKAGQNTPWFQTARDLHNFTSGVHHDRGAVSQGAVYQSDKQDFWAQALPLHDGWTEHATSFVAEQAAQLPVYAAMELGGAALKGGAVTVSGGTNLTKSLLQSNLGKRVFGYLMAGTEGLAYGKATRKQEDKSQAWRDAVGFTVFHGLFDIGGMGLKKLIDVVPDSNTALKTKLEKRNEVLDLAKEGKRPATGAEIYADHKREIANNLTVSGITGQRAIFKDALTHVQRIQDEHSDWSRTQVRDHEHALLNNDPARWGPALSAAKFVRSLVGDKRVADLTSEEQKALGDRIEKLIQDSGAEINTHSEALQKSTVEDTAKSTKAPASKKGMDFYRSKVIAKITKDNPAALQMVKPEQIDSIASKWMAKDAQASAAHAEKLLGKDGVKDATNAAKRVKPAKTEVKVKTVRSESKFGTSASLKALPAETKAYFKLASDSAKENGQSLKSFFEDMSDEDFSKDVSDHFYPKALRDAGVFFESQKTPEGKQDPNFLAFMHNYIGGMPKEFGQELESRLISSMKVQKYMMGKEPTEPQIEYFAKSMYNHMDNFLDSGRWPTESNIFRSSNETMFESTRWQTQLLRERMVEEQKNLNEMFATDPVAKKNALTAYNLLSKRRLEEFKLGPADLQSQHRIKDLNERITEVMTQTGDRERIPF